jgi:hypothetical protein
MHTHSDITLILAVKNKAGNIKKTQLNNKTNKIVLEKGRFYETNCN